MLHQLPRRIVSRLSRQPPMPYALWRMHAWRARRLGLTRLCVVLSFDCDTDRDIEVAEKVAHHLAERKIAATWAVPGEQLKKGASAYRAIAALGYDFINHGYHEHSRLEGGRYTSSFFYDQLPRALVEQDILDGDRTVAEVIGRRPQGFRAPHFGTFQSAEQLRFLHRVLRRLDYRFSTSTVPHYTLRHGPLHRIAPTFAEIPVSGCYSQPLGILDSYGFRFAEGRRQSDEDYAREFLGLVRFFADGGLPGLINTYADPSQVHDFDGFYQVIEELAGRDILTLSYGELLSKVSST